MNQKKESDNSVHLSSLLGMDDNVSAAAVGAVTLAAMFIPCVSYAAWVIPLAAAVAERKSLFARLCDVQLFMCSAVISVCSVITIFITPYAESAMNAAEGNSLIWFGAVGIVMSLLRVICLVFVILISYHAFNKKIFYIPGVTVRLRKLVKYSEI